MIISSPLPQKIFVDFFHCSHMMTKLKLNVYRAEDEFITMQRLQWRKEEEENKKERKKVMIVMVMVMSVTMMVMITMMMIEQEARHKVEMEVGRLSTFPECELGGKRKSCKELFSCTDEKVMTAL